MWSRSSPGSSALRPISSSRSAGSRETPTLEAYRAFTEGWLLLETLDIRRNPSCHCELRASHQRRSSIRARLHRPGQRATGGVREHPVGKCAGAGTAERRGRPRAAGRDARRHARRRRMRRSRSSWSAPGKRKRPCGRPGGPSRSNRPTGGIFSGSDMPRGETSACEPRRTRLRSTPISRSRIFRRRWSMSPGDISPMPRRSSVREPRCRIARLAVATAIPLWACIGCSAWSGWRRMTSKRRFVSSTGSSSSPSRIDCMAANTR